MHAKVAAGRQASAIAAGTPGITSMTALPTEPTAIVTSTSGADTWMSSRA